MLNTMRVDFRRLFSEKWICAIVGMVSVAFPFFLMAVLCVFGKAMNEKIICENSIFTSYAAMIPFYLAILMTFFLHAELEDGILRNKFISGKKRTSVLLSYCSVAAVLAIVMQLLSIIFTAVFAVFLGLEFEAVTPMEIVHYTIITTLAGITVGVFLAIVYLCFCNSKMAMVIPVGIAILMKIVLVEVLDKLYPESSVCTLTGTRLAVYTWIDRYVPFAHLIGELRWDTPSYLIGCGGWLILSLVIGSIVFSRKDIK